MWRGEEGWGHFCLFVLLGWGVEKGQWNREKLVGRMIVMIDGLRCWNWVLFG